MATQEDTTKILSVNSKLPATMVLKKIGTALLETELPVPEPTAGQVLIKVIACGVCRTDLHIIDGELQHPKLPLVPGHEIIGQVIKAGKAVLTLRLGDIIGVPWLAYTCGYYIYCKKVERIYVKTQNLPVIQLYDIGHLIII